MASEWARRLVASAEDVAHEEALLRDPLSLKNWLFYLELKRGAPPELRFTLYERAVRRLPGSYKLWFRYLTERRAACQGRAPRDRLFEEANNAHERALVFMGKYPRIWLDYLGFLAAQHKVTATRKAFDRALQALPITQHHRVWPLYLEFARGCGVPETGMRVYRRLLKLEPQRAEEFVAFLLEHGKRDEAAQQLAALLNDDRFVSQQGKSKQDLWNEFVALVTRHPEEVTSLDADAIIRAGIKRLPHEVGRLWVALADYYTRRGLFEKARDVFEEGLGTVATARDFAQVFDAYTEFEEGLLQAKMAALEEGEEAARARPSGEVGDEAGNLDEDFELAPEDEVELRMARLDDLVQRRPFLLNSALLRQNPHSVAEWMRRVRLFRDDHEQVVLTFSEAVTTVDPAQAVGKPHLLWLAFARYYALRLGDLDSAREVLRKATLVNFRSVDDLASVWCQWAELEIKHGHAAAALQLVREAAVMPSPAKRAQLAADRDRPVQERLFRSTKLWALLADLEESLGTLETVRAVYDAMFELRVVTPQLVLNYAALLEERKFFEEAFRAYEKGVALFAYPHVFPIWSTYLHRFVQRFRGAKLERARDLFEQAVLDISQAEAKTIFLMYARFEETYGLARRAMAIYDRACKAVAPEDRFDMFQIYIGRATELFGLARTRQIFEQAMLAVPQARLKALALQYADLERRLGEVDRARAIYAYGAQFCNPRTDPDFWKVWHEFEVNHGNPDTFREMMRVRRSVVAQFAYSTNFAANYMAGGAKDAKDAKDAGTAVAGMVRGGSIQFGDAAPRALNSMQALEASQRAQPLAPSAPQGPTAGPAPPPGAANPEEIELGEDEGEGEGAGAEGPELAVEQQQVPAAVFGAALEAAAKQAAKQRV